MKLSIVLIVFTLALMVQLTSSTSKSTVDRRSFSNLFKCFQEKTLQKLFKCLSRFKPTTTPTPPTTTTPPMPPGCVHNGQFYPPNSEISKVEDQTNNRCHGLKCDQHGQIVAWNVLNCFPTTVPPSTTPKGCYPPGEISRGEDRGSNWCWGYICGEDGHVMAWDNFSCFPTTPPLPLPRHHQTRSHLARKED